MPLFIRDDDVDALAAKLQAATKSRTKTEAVRLALEHELQRVREKQPASERAAASIAIARTMGPGGGSFDMKTFTDDMWGDI
ncbi:type II toxin-antitoxin system VapB family antitoxin (plasmid) [Bradyrhizobium barranii subsp. apii]|uniref:type II toxin-antitoxin system VapB family antitoxin n=1 Tax=Bradyrhizobium TaxID=374 RepID=UPI0015966264|nr:MULTISPECIES: type II toxin-antitoxin system VapB family antitoxin [Bradyrhizobium]UGY30384.1 type II toxin-antitoxin system VapB family antitoxin [Bradyrhizobium septentrionale]UPU01604.1 type II toxin-antitoxin system VapB family antitoxin [Bradyrhizobium barranii subsp. apii]